MTKRLITVMGVVLVLTAAYLMAGAVAESDSYRFEYIDTIDQVEFDPYQIEHIGQYSVEYTHSEDGHMIANVTNQAGETHMHALPIRGFWGYVTNRSQPANANVAVNLVWSGTQRTTQDVQTCPLCGFYSKYCNVESGYGLMASLNTTGGHSPLVQSSYRCSYDLIRTDFSFMVSIFYIKIC
jgi:hypothetical protein